MNSGQAWQVVSLSAWTSAEALPDRTACAAALAAPVTIWRGEGVPRVKRAISLLIVTEDHRLHSNQRYSLIRL